MNDPKLLKMYIAVLDEVPDHMVPVLVAHAVLGAHITLFKYCGYSPEDPALKYADWLATSFKKVVLRVNQKEFDKISVLDNVYLGHENSTLDGKKSCAVVCPRYDLPNVLKFAKMWKPNEWTNTAEQQLKEVKRLELIVAQQAKRISDYCWAEDARNGNLHGQW